MTTFWLLRHAAHDWLGRGFAGRLPGVGLNAEGRRQAQALAEQFARLPVSAVCSSPQQRTRETAQPLAARHGLAVEEDAGLDEIDFGAWTGCSFDQAQRQQDLWQQWVFHRSSACPPGGEPFAGVPARAMAALERLQARHPEGHVVVVSHGDVLKAVLATCLGMSLDHLERLEIAPASISCIASGPGWRCVKLVNAEAPPGWAAPTG